MRARLLPLLAATAVTLAWAPAASAQTQSGRPDTPAPGATAPSPSITDQKLDAAAAALQRVVSLQKQYRDQLAQTQDASAQQQLIAKANSELAKAVTDQGLSVEEYSSIMQVAQNDPDVRGKLLQRIDPAAAK
jgi:hypothetical protein